MLTSGGDVDKVGEMSASTADEGSRSILDRGRSKRLWGLGEVTAELMAVEIRVFVEKVEEDEATMHFEFFWDFRLNFG